MPSAEILTSNLSFGWGEGKMHRKDTDMICRGNSRQIISDNLNVLQVDSVAVTQKPMGILLCFSTK